MNGNQAALLTELRDKADLKKDDLENRVVKAIRDFRATWKK